MNWIIRSNEFLDSTECKKSSEQLRNVHLKEGFEFDSIKERNNADFRDVVLKNEVRDACMLYGASRNNFQVFTMLIATRGFLKNER